MAHETVTTCPHCSQDLLRMSNPDGTTWGDGYQLVCFNDDCPYFMGGWKWMRENYNASVSYRFRYNPDTGEKGPLPVWSKEALRNLIIE